MFHKRLLTLLLALAAVSMFVSACSPLSASGSAPTPPSYSAPAERLLINTHQGYSVNFPAGYDLAVYSESGVAILERSLLNVEQPRLDIQVEPAEGRSAEQVADQMVIEYPGFELKRSTLTLDSEPAVMLDEVPGQDLNRVILVVHGERLYRMMYIPADKSLEINPKFEELFKVTTGSLDFDPMP